MTNSIIKNVFEKATEVANQAVSEYLTINGEDAYGCGMSTVILKKYNGKQIRKNSKVVKELINELGYKDDRLCTKYRKVVILKTSDIGTQDKNAQKAGAEAFARYLEENGFEVLIHSWLN